MKGKKAEQPSSSTAAIQQLIAAAGELLDKGGSITRRNALREALGKVDEANMIQNFGHDEWNFTPAVKMVFGLAARISKRKGDDWIRTEHLELALRQLPKMPG